MTAIQRSSRTFATFCLSAVTFGMATLGGCQSMTHDALLSQEAQQQPVQALETVLTTPAVQSRSTSDADEAILLRAPSESRTANTTTTAYEEGFATESERIELHNQKWGGNPLR